MSLSQAEVAFIRAAQHEIDADGCWCLRCGDTAGAAWARGYFLPCRAALSKATAPEKEKP